MPDPIATAVIAGVSAVIGGVIAAIARPWGQDWVARHAEDRAAVRDHEKEGKARIEHVREALAGMSPGGAFTNTQENLERDLIAAVHAVGDSELTQTVERLQQMTQTGMRGSEPWLDAHAKASRRVGELVRGE
jgi:hypothetical protein